MIDPKLLRNDLAGVAAALKRRGFVLDTNAYSKLESDRKEVQSLVEGFRNKRNARSKEIGIAKAKGEDTSELMNLVNIDSGLLASSEEKFRKIEESIEAFQLGLPNLLHESVPDGPDENSNKEVRRWG